MYYKFKYMLSFYFYPFPDTKNFKTRIAIVELYKSGKLPRGIAKLLNVNRMLVWRPLKQFVPQKLKMPCASLAQVWKVKKCSFLVHILLE